MVASVGAAHLRGSAPPSALLIAGQALRAAGYGFTAVLLGALLADRGYGTLRAGVVRG